MSKNTVKGRLNRESNEVPNTIPGYNPQFFDENGYATDITPRNPLPTADYGMTEGGLWIPKKVSDDGAQHTQLTGSNVEDGILVKDNQVLTELEEVRMSQSVIANKVSEPPTEEVELFKDVVLEPEQLVGSTQILKGFDYFILGHNSVGKHTSDTPVNVTVTVRYRSSSNTWLSGTETLTTLKESYGISERIEVSTPQVYLAFRNNTDKPMALNNIFIFKVK